MKTLKIASLHVPEAEIGGYDTEIVLSQIGAFRSYKAGYDNLPPVIYQVMVQGHWFAVKDKAEYERIKQFHAESK